jgi:hypothetical protein
MNHLESDELGLRGGYFDSVVGCDRVCRAETVATVKEQDGERAESVSIELNRKRGI